MIILNKTRENHNKVRSLFSVNFIILNDIVFLIKIRSKINHCSSRLSGATLKLCTAPHLITQPHSSGLCQAVIGSFQGRLELVLEYHYRYRASLGNWAYWGTLFVAGDTLHQLRHFGAVVQIFSLFSNLFLAIIFIPSLLKESLVFEFTNFF